MKTIGMIGIGMMGHGIASNIQKAGYTLSLLEHSGNQPLDTLLEKGARLCQTAKELAQTCDILILCVTGSPQVEAVLQGPDGILAGIKPKTLIIDCSTALPSSTQQIAQQVQQLGGYFLDAPMTRTPKEAAEGRLNLLVGGDQATLDLAMPVLRCFAENIFHTGPVSSGHLMKLLHNYVSLGQIALLSEAAACAAQAQIAPEVLVNVLAQGGGGGVALERVRPYWLEQDPNALRFTLANASKDLNYYTTMAKENACAHQIAQAIAHTLAQSAEQAPQRFLPELVNLLQTASPQP